MSEPVFSAEYAASLVQRARDGATFIDLFLNGDLYPRRICGGLNEHWVEWHREAKSAFYMADNTHVEISVGGKWEADFAEAAIDLWLMLESFRVSVLALGSLCQLPEDWTDAHREAARVIGGG